MDDKGVPISMTSYGREARTRAADVLFAAVVVAILACYLVILYL